MIKPSLTLKRRLNATPAKVYAAWTDPSLLARWMGPDGIETIRADCDPRVGGRYRFVMQRRDGEIHEVGGVFREVTPNESLSFTWAWRSTPELESLVTVRIRPDGDGSLVTLIHEQFTDEPSRDRHETGWSQSLDRLVQQFP